MPTAVVPAGTGRFTSAEAIGITRTAVVRRVVGDCD